MRQNQPRQPARQPPRTVYRQPRRPTQYQAQFSSDWAKIWGCLFAAAAVLAFLAWPYWVWHSWIADGIWWGLLVVVVIVGYVSRTPKPKPALPAPKPPQQALCLYVNAVKVGSAATLGDTETVYGYWCPDCNPDPDSKTLLPANFRFPCCGAPPGDKPGEGHWHTCRNSKEITS